jgi:secondary thiamine-phosphate synthase enzyme
MHGAATAPTRQHARIRITTDHPLQFVDLTDRVESFVADAGLDAGLVNVQSLHTTTAIVVNEHEPLLLEDFGALFEATAPSGAVYRHDDMDIRTVNLVPEERRNGHAHCRALLLPTSACLNVIDGRLQIGTWQRILLVELDGPRTRDISILLIGDGRR